MPEQDIKETILLIEDDAGVAELVCEKLGEAGRHVAHVKSGRQARAWLEHNHPGLILLDYSLPDMTGAEFVEQMGDMPPFIVTTGAGDEVIAVSMMKRGAKDYLVKDSRFLDNLPLVVEHVLKDVAAERQLANALAALRASEERLQLALFAAGQGLYDLNIQTGKVIVSPEYARMLGYEPGEFVETYAAWRERLHPDDIERVLRADEAYFSSIGGDYRSEYRQRTKDGSWKWIISRGKIVEHDTAGKPLRMIGIHADISAHKQAEEKIKETRLLLEASIESQADMLILSIDKDYRYLYFNTTYKNIMLNIYGNDVKLGMNLLECIANAEDREAAKTNYDRALAGESHVAIQEYGELERTFYETRYNPIINDRKEIIGATAFSADITERKRAAAALVIQKRIADIFMTVADNEVYNEILQTILNAMRSPFGMLGYLERDGILTVPAMTRQIWDEPRQIPEKTVRFPQETWKDSSWPRAIREKRVVYSNTASANIPEGHIGILRHISQPIILQGEAIGIIQVSNKAGDYTEADLNALNAIAGYIAPILHARLQREYAEAETRQLNAELEQRVVERTRELSDAQEKLVRQEKLVVMGQLAGSVAHEMRNPLGVITNAIYFLKTSMPDAKEKIKEYLNIVDSEARLANKIVTDLLDFARVKTLKRKPAVVSELIDLALERFPVPRSVELTLEIPADLPPIYADWYHVVQILGNLIVNACQAMPEGGKLTVSSEQLSVSSEQPALSEVEGTVSSEQPALSEVEGPSTVYRLPSIVNRQSQIVNRQSAIVISVKDTGIGIPPENIGKLFEPLFSTKINGIGLGLPVSHKLAEANGGRIEVQSEVGVGSTFSLWLPVQEQ